MRVGLRVFSQFAVLLALLSLQAPWAPLRSLAAESVATVRIPSLSELEREILDRLKRVEEFKFIEQEAGKLGVRAWLFGGTAAGYAHYVKWDLQREKGDSRFQPDRFDYDYTSIYRSTQDLDIVIDGNAEQAQALQNALTGKYPHLQGSKTAWEVRLLTQSMGDKQAILNNPDFMNQHTDSNSTGLIEITKPLPGESVVRDVRDWKSKEPLFLKDVHDGTLHYYFSPLHDTTKFAKEGRNPPIISAIRYLTKAFQYELQLRPEDLAQIKKVIDEFDPRRANQNSYVSNWIEKNGKKLIQNAVNIEYATDTLEQLGLRKKLQAIRDDASVVGSLSWWMNKEPLRLQVLGQGSGKTGKELGLDVVAHETGNFLAYESITRAHTGDPNVLISRDGAAGEAALFGNGFYTQTGRQGRRGTGFAIRFRLDPNARENTDFIRAEEYGFIIIKNKAALKVIPESLKIGPVEYFQMLAQGQTDLDAGDRGILEKLKWRIGAKNQALTDDQATEIATLVKTNIEQGEQEIFLRFHFFDNWFALPVSQRHPEVFETLLKKATVDQHFARYVLSKPQWDSRSDWIEAMLRNGTIDKDIAKGVLSHPACKDHPEWVEALLKNGTVDKEILRALSQPHWQTHPEWVEALLKKGATDKFTRNLIAVYVLAQPHWQDHPEWLEALLKKRTVDVWILRDLISKPHWRDHPELRRLVQGAEPTVENLRLALKQRDSSPAQCLIRRLTSFLKLKI